jgi:hypothetical protein
MPCNFARTALYFLVPGIGYYEPYATRHATLDTDDVQKEVVNVALAVVKAVTAIRAGKLEEPDANLEAPRAK